jgi:uncharacterized protein (TIGR00266 family)
MQIDIQHRPSYALAIVRLERGERIRAEAGAMVSMSEGIRMETKMQGGLFGALKRSVLGGESFFINTFIADAPGEVTLAPDLPGDIVEFPVDGETYIQSGSYLASSEGIEIDTKWGGAKSFFSREGLFLLKATGKGTVLVSSFGAIHRVDLAPGQKYIVDTGHMVAFDSSVHYTVRTAGGIKATLFSGEGLVCEYTGPGRLWLQTRSTDAFLSWLIPKLPSK